MYCIIRRVHANVSIVSHNLVRESSMDIGRFIFVFVMSFILLSMHDRFIPNWFTQNRQPHVWLVYWKANIVFAFVSAIISLLLNAVLGN